MYIYDPGTQRNDLDKPAAGEPVKSLNLNPANPAVPTAPPKISHPSHQGGYQLLYTWDMRAKTLQFGEDVHYMLGIHTKDRILSEHEWIAMLYKDDQGSFLDMRRSLAVKPTPFTFDYRMTAPNGRTYVVSQKGMPYPIPAENDKLVGVIDMDESPLSLSIAANCNLQSMTSELSEGDEAVLDYSLQFVRELRNAIETAKRDQTQGALLIISINNLAMIINAFGHKNADQVMNDLEAEIKKRLQRNDRIERIHRDQLAIIAPHCQKEEMETLVERIRQAIRAYGVNSSLGAMHVTNSIGGVDFPGSATSAVEAIDRAYMALNSAHDGHYKSYITSQNEMQASRQQMGLASHLRRAMEENRMRLAFQPVIESKTGRIAHYEALLRIIGNDGKISSAGPLIPVAEQMNMIDIVDTMVFDMVMKELIAAPNVILAMNVSNLTTDDQQWLDHAKKVLNEHPEPASRLIVEITETAAQRDLRKTSYFVASLQALGVRIALDDFGSGYTSFRQLKALSVDMVKIDGAFVRDIVNNADNRFFVKTLMDFINGFGLEAVAEYVEHGETAKMLMDLGVHMLQGYYFGKPENHRSWLNQGEFKKG